MPEKYAVNERIKEVMTALGEPRVDPFYKKRWGEKAVSERLRTVVAKETGVKTDFIVEFTEKIATHDGRKVNGHWLLFGEGDMFLEEKVQPQQNHSEAAVNETLKTLSNSIATLTQANLVSAQTIAQLLPREVVKEG